MIYHLLTELEPLSVSTGGALSKDVANILRQDPMRKAVCISTDGTWGLEEDRLLVPPLLSRYRKIRGRRFLPLWIHKPLLRFVFRPLLEDLGEGDLVWCHNQPFFAAALEKEIHKRRAKLVYHAHDGHANYAVRNAFGSFTADAYIFVSNALRERWLSLFPRLENTHAVHNGADQELFYPSPMKAKQNDIPVILYVGRLNPEKGVHVLIEAMKILENRGVQAVCRIVGGALVDKHKTNLYKKRLFENSPSCVRFEGRRSARQIADEYRSADILCCPSVWQEPFGNVNIEAMACGIPVAASRVGGIPEIASEGGVILVEPNCAVELADALQNLVEDKVLRAKVAADGLSSFRRRFTWVAIFKQYKEVSDDLCLRAAAAME